ncbi:MAG: UDP-N-acetylmuramoyl-L-alanyl-D-glutamate--2,6-diaminopimelate ligase [Ignavibacteriae bacterium]|nr:UDP-N-acetylmuramoyl-L-alanyl-D-glutamate--2,6-diaminopimelate ligase [Ignavibacteriota bacterium]
MFQTMYGKMVVTHDVEVNSIQYDSRKIQAGDLFVAIKGGTVDGHTFIGNAVANGAKVVVVEDDAAIPDAFFMHSGVVKVVVGDARKALALMSSTIFGHPSQKLRLIGVTGTNGKTSTTHLIKSILEADGKTVGLIGTIEYKVGADVIPATHTTPESLELNQLLATMVGKGCSDVVMEVSSHSLALRRVYGLNFAAATFTNLTQDHLDFHVTMDAYYSAKKILFDTLPSTSVAVTNVDDAYGREIVSDTHAKRISYSLEGDADITATNVRLSPTETSFNVIHNATAVNVTSKLIGRFNVQNILAAYATGIGLGIAQQTVLSGIKNLHAVAGRFQQIVSPDGWVAVIDYAHTHDALANCLHAIHDIAPKDRRGRIITVFGAGGNRDKSKRPKMGRVASELSDITIITSDNPRREEPAAIAEDVRAGVAPDAVVVVEMDRRKAIALALEMAQAGDIVLLAGKGHENYQVIGDQKLHFDDREEVESFIHRKKR